MINAIAIDDEPVALEIIRSLVQKVPFLNLQAVFVNAFEAKDYLDKQQVDLLFLDIKMPDISGIEFYQLLTQKPLVIFTTAYSEHAVKSYELEAIDYLLKPFSSERFQKACEKAKSILELQATTRQSAPLFLKSGYEKIRVDPQEILFVESAGNYMTFALPDRKILTRLTMAETLAMLPQPGFVRVHRSFIIAKDKVTKIEKQQLHLGTYVVPVGNMYAEEVAGMLNF
ncbi:LytTR family DNA-binding domain-containing protein [Dyadobacter sp. CY312]|uniref:LytR/AlgR family response regulator transcription factor n=1 Tax=Dyadobacter sp. CY312 TaxID=2907303 RepID=UPI001F1BE9BC|nr:LytTR family DNA-binding domain-containing protein [Dyadobacter sp. CY312]MCE7040333.1 LytTR family DNA-binding domain-containing protein [Dyadobacter sp. CY312]